MKLQMDKPVHTNPSGHKENLRLRRPGRPGRAPGRYVRLRPPGKVPTAPGVSGRGPEQRRERRQQREQPTSGAAHPELLPDSLPLPPPPPPPPATSLRHRSSVGGVTALRERGLFALRGIPPREQVVPRDLSGSEGVQTGSMSGRQLRGKWVAAPHSGVRWVLSATHNEGWQGSAALDPFPVFHRPRVPEESCLVTSPSPPTPATSP